MEKILVTGDFVLDHHIYEGSRYHYGDNRSRGVQEVKELGGAALVHYLLQELLAPRSEEQEPTWKPYLAIQSKGREPVPNPDVPIPSGAKAHAFWRPTGGKQGGDGGVWRVADVMGFGGAPGKSPNYEWPVATDLPDLPDIVVVSDGGMGFRQKVPQSLSTAFDQARWIVLKTASPIMEGDLWKLVTQPVYRSKLVVIVSAQDLRKSEAQISERLSWEETIANITLEVGAGGELAPLIECRHLIIAFESDGGLWLDLNPTEGGGSATGTSRRMHFVYEASSVEGEHRRARSGKAFGFLSCLTAAVAWQLAENSDHPDFEYALEGGLSAMHDLLENGHGRACDNPDGFPSARLAKVIREATCRYARAVFTLGEVGAPGSCQAPRAAVCPDKCWSVLHQALRAQGSGCPAPAYELAKLVVRRGPIALGSIPNLTIGNLMSVERHEIESLRVLRRIIQDYKANAPCKKPLSIGVFGPPGAGKSFAVEEIAGEILTKGDKESWMEFNLSQFGEGTDDLIGAFHQIRDRVLKGKIPVAFFDEFDSREYEWLQYLLAPMQDGHFQQGQVTHPIGNCVFIFAGGTSQSFETFGPPDADIESHTKFRLAKGPDFKSRLDGFLNVMGPNPRRLASLKPNAKAYDYEKDICDICFPIRRALMIRSGLGCAPGEKLGIDEGLLHALLHVGLYTHGARSLSKTLEPFRAARPGFLHRSLIPPQGQLALHTDGAEFMKLCRSIHCHGRVLPPITDDTRNKVAVAIHETFRLLGRKEGWLGQELDVDFPQLSDFLQRSNLAAADRISVKVLPLIGLQLVAGKNTDAEKESIRQKFEYNLEMLAEAEHHGWMEWHLDQGWMFAPGKKDEKKRTHPCLVPYLQLSDVDRNKDRNAIRHYLEFVERAGMKIIHSAAPSPPMVP